MKPTMITEFTCGIYTAKKDNEWLIYERHVLIGYISENGTLMYWVNNISYWSEDMLRNVADLMTKINTQYKHLQTN